MGTSSSQPSFAKGELGPDLQGRTDVSLFRIALNKLRNFFVMRFGGIQTRPGTQYIGRVKSTADGKVKLIPFIFSQAVTFMLEFGNLYIRFIKAGAYVTETAKNITAINLSTGFLTSVAHGFSNGDWIYLADILGTTQLNGRTCIVAGKTADTFRVADMDGTLISFAAFTAYVSGGTAARIYTLTSTYVTADLQSLNYVQSANVLTITHNNYPPADLSRVSDASWTLTNINFKPGIDGPGSCAIGTPSGSAGTTSYQVTAISGTQEESLPGLGTPVAVEAYSLTASTNTVNIKVTAHGHTTGDTVIVAATNPLLTITSTTCAALGANIVFTANGHGLTNTDSLYVNSISSALALVATLSFVSGASYAIANVTANTFTLTGVTGSTAYAANSSATIIASQPYISGYAGQWTITVIGVDNFSLQGATVTQTLTVSSSPNATVTSNSFTAATSGTPGAGTPNVLTWTASVGAVQYNIYELKNGIYGYIGTTQTLTFSDPGLTPDPLNNPPIANNPFSTAGNYPACCCYYQQRLGFANTTNEVAAAWFSQVGRRTNFTYHIPPGASDFVKFTLIGNNEVNPILGMMDVRRLVVFTAAGEWQIVGNGSGVLTATDSPDARQSSSYGSSTLRPLLTNAEALYVQAQGGMIRNLEYKFTSDNYEGLELSLTANHLFEGYTILDWAYQKIPNSIVWMVRSDGQLLALTYVKEQEVQAWAHCDLLGQVTPISSAYPVIASLGVVENVCCIPEGKETALYLVINRNLYGSNLRYVERLSTRLIGDIKVYNATDSALTYNGFNTGTTSLQFSGGSNYTYGEHLTLTASANTFASTDNGKAFFVYTVPVTPLQPLQEVRFVVDNYVSSTQVQGHVLGEPVHSSLVSGSSTNWARAVNQVTGLYHLKNQAVSVFGDGYVIANPMNQLYPIRIVDALGNLTLDTDKYYAIVTVGLPVTADVETLDLYSSAPDQDINEKMIVTGISFLARKTRGIWAGAAFPAADAYGSQDTSQAGLERQNPRDAETDGYDTPHNLAETERSTMPIQGNWTNTGRAVIRVTDPVPATILAVSVNGIIMTTKAPQAGK